MPGRPIATWIRRAQVRETAGALTLLALLLQASVPTGFMPAGDGAAFLKLCNGWTTELRGAPHDRTVHHGASVCAFAAATTLGAAPAWASAPLTAVIVDFWLFLDTSSAQIGLSGPPRAQTPRAPPALNSESSPV